MTNHETTAEHPTNEQASSHGAAGHDSTLRNYYYTFGSLVLLLFLTVEVARHDLGSLNFPMTMLIATVKAVLILAIFMNLRAATTLTKLFAILGFIFLGIMFVFTLADYFTRPNFF